MSSSTSQQAAGGACPFCSHAYSGAPNRCTRCGTLLGEAAHDLKRLGVAERRFIRERKALADTTFLVGLLLGGPLMTTGDHLRIGVFIVLAGGLASVLRRYSDLSFQGSLAVGSLCAMVVAALVVDPATGDDLGTAAAEDAREAFVNALSQGDADMYVETRGVGAVAIWFQPPGDRPHECGDFPPEEVRTHLRDLGFLRVVVAEQNQSGGLCSFPP